MIKVKICGITNLEDALAAVEYGADALGFVFAPSPRRMTIKKAQKIIQSLPPFICKVGVFVDSELAIVKETMSLCNLDLVQLHGNEGPDYVAALFPKAIKVFTSYNLPAETKLSRYRATAFMLDIDKTSRITDAKQRQLWQLARQIRKYGPVILAGGLTPKNVSEAIEIARPYAVDVSSGVEAKPGKKDHAMMRAFLRAVKGTGAASCVYLENKRG